MPFAGRKCLMGSRWYKLHLGSKPPKTTNFGLECQISGQINTLEKLLNGNRQAKNPKVPLSWNYGRIIAQWQHFSRRTLPIGLKDFQSISKQWKLRIACERLEIDEQHQPNTNQLTVNLKAFKLSRLKCGNHCLKTAKVGEHCQAIATLLGINELTYSLPITNRYSTILTFASWTN
jgi:hypothetical protein